MSLQYFATNYFASCTTSEAVLSRFPKKPKKFCVIVFSAVNFPMPHIFDTVLHPDNACITGSQEIDALCFSAVPFIETNFLDLSNEAKKYHFPNSFLDSSAVAI